MSKLFLDVLMNAELVDGYQIEDSIARKYDLKPGDISPFTRLRVEVLSPEQARKLEIAKKKAELLSIDNKLSKCIANITELNNKLASLYNIQNDIKTKTDESASLKAEQTPSILNKNQPKIIDLEKEIENLRVKERELLKCADSKKELELLKQEKTRSLSDFSDVMCYRCSS